MGSTSSRIFTARAYFNSDLAVFKTFKITERQSLEFRASAFNFLNHPLDSFQNNGDLKLNINQTSSTRRSVHFRERYDGSACGRENAGQRHDLPGIRKYPLRSPRDGVVNEV